MVHPPSQSPPHRAGATTEGRTDDHKIRVLLVDDSAVIRGMMTKILGREPDIHIVKSAADGQRALDAVHEARPDVILLDIEMPNMDGMTALPKLLDSCPDAKIVMCSTLTVRNAQITMEALRLGATECLAKPTSPQDILDGGDFQQNLIHTVRGLGADALKKRGALLLQTQTAQESTAQRSADIVLNKSATFTGVPSLLAIGCSTGGPQALFDVLAHLKGIRIPVILTQHMPATFTKILAQHISTHTGMTAIEAEDGMEIENGIVYVAPGAYHMLLKRTEAGKIVTVLDNSAPINFCKPAVDPMFESAIRIYGNKVLGVILTGMGQDGLEGSKTLVEAGGRLIAQDKESSVVWGMPGAVAEEGLCSEILPLKDIGPWLHKAIMGG